MHPLYSALNSKFYGGWYFILLCLLIGSTACGNDQEENPGPQLFGRWEIDKALRNGRTAESLSSLYFQFDPNGSFATNISGDTEQGQFIEVEGKITTTNLSMPLEYTIVELADSSLLLKSTVARYRFEFYLLRVADQSQVPAEHHTSK